MSKQCELRSKVGGLALQPRSEGSRCIGDLIAFVDTAARQQRALAGEAPLALWAINPKLAAGLEDGRMLKRTSAHDCGRSI